MDKREFVQRYIIKNYNGNILDNKMNVDRSSDKRFLNQDINNAIAIFDKIEEVFTSPVNSTNLWDYNDK